MELNEIKSYGSKVSAVILFLMMCNFANAQQTISLQDALNVAKQNNKELQIADVEIENKTY